MRVVKMYRHRVVGHGLIVFLLFGLSVLVACQVETAASLTITIEPARPTLTATPQPTPTPRASHSLSATTMPTVVREMATPANRTPTATATPIWSISSVQLEPILIAFVGIHPSMADTRPNPTAVADPTIYPRLYTIWSDGTDLRTLVDAPVAPPLAWSPDGERIAFVLFEDDNLYTIRVDGTELRQITHFTEEMPIEFIDWSPDGRQVVFESTNHLYLVNVESGEVEYFTEGSYPDWSADGEFILIRRYPEIYQIRPDGSDLKCFSCEFGHEANQPEWWFETKTALFKRYRDIHLVGEAGHRQLPRLPDHLLFDSLLQVPPSRLPGDYFLAVPRFTFGKVHLLNFDQVSYQVVGEWHIPLFTWNVAIRP